MPGMTYVTGSPGKIFVNVESFCLKPESYISNIRASYRPQRSWGKVMFLQVSVILFTRGGSALLHSGIHPTPGADPPQDQRQAPPPRAVHAGRYGQEAGGTNPTGMQSYFLILFPVIEY